MSPVIELLRSSCDWPGLFDTLRDKVYFITDLSRKQKIL